MTDDTDDTDDRVPDDAAGEYDELEDDGVLGAADTLEGDPGDDPLDQGIIAPDRWSAGERYGTTLAEERAGESIEQLLAEEEPDQNADDLDDDELSPGDDAGQSGQTRTSTGCCSTTAPIPGPDGSWPRTREHTRTSSPTWSRATSASTPEPPPRRKRRSTWCPTTTGTSARTTKRSSAPRHRQA
jgi:hypothetical protein